MEGQGVPGIAWARRGWLMFGSSVHHEVSIALPSGLPPSPGHHHQGTESIAGKAGTFGWNLLATSSRLKFVKRIFYEIIPGENFKTPILSLLLSLSQGLISFLLLFPCVAPAVDFPLRNWEANSCRIPQCDIQYQYRTIPLKPQYQYSIQ